MSSMSNVLTIIEEDEGFECIWCGEVFDTEVECNLHEAECDDNEELEEELECQCPGGEELGPCHCPYCAGGGR